MSIKDLKKSVRTSARRDVAMSIDIDIVLHKFSKQEKESLNIPSGANIINMPSKLVRAGAN